MSSEGIRTNKRWGKRYPSKKESKVVQKQAPAAGLQILMLDGSNFTIWKQSMHNYLLTKYSYVGQFIQTEVLWRRPTPNPVDVVGPNINLTAAEIKSTGIALMLKHQKLLDRDAESYVEIWGLLQSCITEDGLTKVRTDAAYANALAAYNVVELYSIIRRVHTWSVNNGASPEDLQYIGYSKYFRISQAKGQSLESFKTQFLEAVANLRHVNYQPIPTDEQQARHFFMKLHPDHLAFQAHVKNRDAVQFPRTIQQVIDQCERFVSIGSNGVVRGQPMVYATDLKKTTECFNCGKTGHWARECNLPDQRKVEEKSNESHQSEEKKTADEAKSGSVDAEKKPTKKKSGKKNNRKSSYQITVEDLYSFMVQERLCDVSSSEAVKEDGDCIASIGDQEVIPICMDSLSNTNFVKDKRLLYDRYDSAFVADCIGGAVDGAQMGTLPGFGRAIVTPNATVNGIALFEMEKYDVKWVKGKYYLVTIDCDTQIYFNYDAKSKAYIAMFSKDLLQKLKESDELTRLGILHCHAVSVRENEARFSKAEVQKARDAREAMKRLGYPSDQGLIEVINGGRILNLPITARDVVRATAIYGKDVASLKGKTPRPGNTWYEEAYVPRSLQKSQIAHIDYFFWHGQRSLAVSIKPLGLIIVQPTPGKTSTIRALGSVNYIKNLLHTQGFSLVRISSDGESVFVAAKKVSEIDWTIVGPKTHEEHVERDIRTIKERARSVEWGLQYKLPARLVKWVIMHVATCINATKRNADNISVRECFTGVKLNWERDFRVAFGEYVQASVASDNTNSPEKRTVGAIALGGTNNSKGSVRFFDLQTERVITIDKWIELPIPTIVIDKMNQLHDKDILTYKLDTELEDDEDTPREVEDVRALQQPALEEIRDPPLPSYVLEEVQEGQVEELVSNESVESHQQVDDDIPGVNEAAMIDGYGHIMQDGVRKSNRIASRHRFAVNRVSVKEAINLYGDLAESAVLDELGQMLKKKVFRFIGEKEWRNMKGKKKCIQSLMFLKEKRDLSGMLLKIKARLVAGGHQQDRDIYEKVSAPTVSTAAILTILSMAVQYALIVCTGDVTGAFLEALMPADVVVFMRIQKELARMLCKLCPELSEYLCEDGSMRVQLLRALYGCIQSAKLWYDTLVSILIDMGFVINELERCVFKKVHDDGRLIIVCFHVDDLLIAASDRDLIDEFESGLKSRLDNVTFDHNEKQKYLGMEMTRDEVGIHLKMKQYSDECLQSREAELKGMGKVNSPADENLFEEDDDLVLLPPEEQAKFHHDVAKVLYLTMKVRPDLLTAVSYLCTRVNKANEKDIKKLLRLFAYVRDTSEMGLSYTKSDDYRAVSYVDASFATHADGTSRTGAVEMLGKNFIMCKSRKQKLISLSSCESELYALSEQLVEMLWFDAFVKQLDGSINGPKLILEDNKSVISLLTKDRHNKQRTKHLNVRYFHLKDKIDKGEVGIEYVQTEDNIADILTKPLNGRLFLKLRAKLMNLSDVRK